MLMLLLLLLMMFVVIMIIMRRRRMKTIFPLSSEVRGMGLRIVYVTMGSMQVLEPFQVRAFFEGLSALSPQCAVAWSLKPEQQAFLPGGVEALPPHFFVQKWLPQGLC